MHSFFSILTPKELDERRKSFDAARKREGLERLSLDERVERYTSHWRGQLFDQLPKGTVGVGKDKVVMMEILTNRNQAAPKDFLVELQSKFGKRIRIVGGLLFVLPGKAEATVATIQDLTREILTAGFKINSEAVSENTMLAAEIFDAHSPDRVSFVGDTVVMKFFPLNPRAEDWI